MKKLVSITFILAFVLFVAPSQSYAAWWDFPSWFSKNQQQPQKATSSDTTSGSQIVDQGIEKVEQENALAPSNNTKSSDAKTIEDLRAEVATLKTNLDKLYTAHNALLEYTKTIASSGKSVGTATNNSNLEGRIADLENKIKLTTGSNVSLDILNITNRVSELERKEKLTSNELYGDDGLNLKVARLQSFGNSVLESKVSILEKTIENICGWVFTGVHCPLSANVTGSSIENKIKKLEGGY